MFRREKNMSISSAISPHSSFLLGKALSTREGFYIHFKTSHNIRGLRSILSHCPLMSSHKDRADLSSLVSLVFPINSASKTCFSSTVFFEDVEKGEALLFQCYIGFVGNQADNVSHSGTFSGAKVPQWYF